MAYLTNVFSSHTAIFFFFFFGHKFKYSSELISYHCANTEGELEKERLTDKAQTSVKCSLSIIDPQCLFPTIIHTGRMNYVPRPLSIYPAHGGKCPLFSPSSAVC